MVNFLIKEGVLEERVCPLGCLLCRCWLQEEVVVAGLGQLGSVGLQEGGGQLQGVQVHHQVRAQLPVTQPGAQGDINWHSNNGHAIIPEVFMLIYQSWENELFLVILITGGVNKMEHTSYRGVLDQTIHDRVEQAVDGVGQM